MRGPVLRLERILVVLAMIEVPRHLMQLLPERAAEGDIHLLETTADAKYGYSGLDRPADQRQRGRIARRIVQRARGARWPLVALWLDIGGAAGEQQAVQPVTTGLQRESPLVESSIRLSS